IVSCAVFSAIAGSSVATAATIGSVALPYFERTRYNPRMVLGSLAAGGALGNLIPPGITFIVYGLITESSVGKLYPASFIPGFLILSGFVLNYVLSSLRLPQALAQMVKGFALPPWGIMLIIIGFYMALGTFMEGFSMIITTLPVVFPVVIALGYDPIWFGVVI